MPKRYYITTPIYYVNSVPHIGTGLTTLAADVTSRFQRMQGQEPYFLTGTDENGLKVMEAAAAAGMEPMPWVDKVSSEFKTIWQGMNIRYDDFIRTTETRHFKTAQRVFEVLKEKGYVTVGKYEGWYDVSTETFYKESDIVDGKSPDGNEVRWVEEENWFFKLSAFEDQLLAHIEAHPEFILPAVRRNEVVSFIKQGLRDMCITRNNPGWGIPIPGDESKVLYVWFDALINYLSATGWPEEGWQQYWPANVEWMAKDILTRFHATLWPAMLLGLGLPLPKTLVGHGFVTRDGQKMSKSIGNVVAPVELAKQLTAITGCAHDLAIDAVRYYMAATIPFESDSDFTIPDFKRRYNGDLANDLGNALNRSLAMAHKFAEGQIPGGEVEPEAAAAIAQAKAAFEGAMAEFRLEQACSAALDLIRFLNKYIDTRAPWALAKAGDPALPAVMRSMLLCLRAAEGLFRPMLPSAADGIAKQLNLAPLTDWAAIGTAESLPAGTALNKPRPLFPRIDPKAEAQAEGQAEPAKQKKEKPAKPSKPKFEQPAEIEFTDFMRVALRVGRVVEAEPVEGSEKLVKMQVMIGAEKRQIVAGIRKSYAPIDLIGRQVIVVANLKPAKLMGLESQGMVLAADGPDGKAILLQPDAEAPEGTTVH